MATAVAGSTALHQHQWQHLLAFKAKAFTLLEVHATVNTLLFSALNNLCASKQPISEALMATVETAAGAVQAVLISTGPLGPRHQVNVSHGISREAAQLITQQLLREGPYTHICGSAESIATLREALASVNPAKTWRINMRINLMALKQLKQPSRPAAPGAALVQCDPVADKELVLAWMPLFMADVWHSPPPSTDSVADYVGPQLRARHVYKYVLLQDQPTRAAGGADGSGPEPVSLVACSATSDRAVRITALYTPPQHRNKGYGTHAVAALCRHLHGQRIDHISLCADEKAPVANRMYQGLGFQHEAELHTATWRPPEAA